MTGDLDVNNKQITNLGLNIQNSNDVICLGFADTKYVQNTAIEKLNMNNHTIDNLRDPTGVRQATQKIRRRTKKICMDKQIEPSHKTNQSDYLYVGMVRCRSRR